MAWEFFEIGRELLIQLMRAGTTNLFHPKFSPIPFINRSQEIENLQYSGGCTHVALDPRARYLRILDLDI